MRFPAKLGECIDLAYTLQQDYLALKAKADAAAAKVKEVEDHILNTFPKAGLEGAKGSVAVASLTRSTVGTIKDFPAFWEWARKNDAGDLLYRRVNNSAYREWLEAGMDAPGIEPFLQLKLSVRKIR